MALQALWRFMVRVVTTLYGLQASLADLLQPQQLLGGSLLNLSRAHVIWTCKKERKEGVGGMMAALSSCQMVKHGGRGTFEVIRADQYGLQGVMKVRHYSSYLRVLRILHIDIIQTQGRDLLVEAKSHTTTVIPSFIPFAPLIGLGLWWLPVLDRSKNNENLCVLRRVIKSHGWQVEEVRVRAGASLLGSELNEQQETEDAAVELRHKLKAQ